MPPVCGEFLIRRLTQHLSEACNREGRFEDAQLHAMRDEYRPIMERAKVSGPAQARSLADLAR
jgi:hypothetical protein